MFEGRSLSQCFLRSREFNNVAYSITGQVSSSAVQFQSIQNEEILTTAFLATVDRPMRWFRACDCQAGESGSCHAWGEQPRTGTASRSTRNDFSNQNCLVGSDLSDSFSKNIIDSGMKRERDNGRSSPFSGAKDIFSPRDRRSLFALSDREMFWTIKQSLMSWKWEQIRLNHMSEKAYYWGKTRHLWVESPFLSLCIYRK